jgi:hypothetical protein
MGASEAILWARIRTVLGADADRWNGSGTPTVQIVSEEQARRQEAIAHVRASWRSPSPDTSHPSNVEDADSHRPFINSQPGDVEHEEKEREDEDRIDVLLSLDLEAT